MPLLVPKLWFLVESSRRKEVLSGSLRGHHNCPLKKDVQLESCELSFIWGKMRTAAQEAAPQRALKLLQSSSGGKSIYKVLVKREFSTMKYSFYKRIFVSHEGLMAP